MESLLKLSGLLNEEDGDKDLGTLEKRLADKTYVTSRDGISPDRSASISQVLSSNGSHHATPQMEKPPTPNRSTTSPEPSKEPEEEVEALSDMMCSLVTNNCGETRYIGRLRAFRWSIQAYLLQGHLLVSPSSRRKEFNGSMRKLVIVHFKR